MRVLARLLGAGKQYPSGSATDLMSRFGARKGRRWALAPISLEIATGQSLAILGRNGSGKSTLLGITAGTIAPTVGRVERRVDPTLLFQVGTAFDEELSGAENARLELLLRGLRGRNLQLRLAEAREFSEIEEAWEEPLRTYSAGMRGRLALAAALADHGPLLLVDEILAVGDAAFVAKCISRFRTIRESGTTVVFVSHSADLAGSLADQALVLDHGLLVMHGQIDAGLRAYAELLGAPAAVPV